MDLGQYKKDSNRTLADHDAQSDLIHSSLGLVTELGELLDSFKRFIFYKKDIDLVNVREELGDIMWYLAIPMRIFNISFNEFPMNVTGTHLTNVINTYPNGDTNYLNTMNDATALSQDLRLLSPDNSVSRDQILLNLKSLKEHVIILSTFIDNTNFMNIRYLNSNVRNLNILINNALASVFILSTDFGFSVSDVMDTNIDKLKFRFPEAFNETKALERDLDKERSILEK